MGVSTWQYRRSRFNHDWLKNQYIPALGKLQNLLNGQIEDFEYEAVFVERIMTEWGVHREEALALPRDFEQGMSPRSLFGCPPLSYCDEETVKVHSELTHVLWLARYPVRRWVAESCARAIEADEAYNKFHAALMREPNLRARSGPLQLLSTDFYGACCKLAKAIEQFPSSVRVT